jgi:hypothetical protein
MKCCSSRGPYLLLVGLTCSCFGKSYLWLCYLYTRKHLGKANILCLYEVGNHWSRSQSCRSHHCVVELHPLRWRVLWMRIMLLVCNAIRPSHPSCHRLWLRRCWLRFASWQRDARDDDRLPRHFGRWDWLSSRRRSLVSS